MYIFAQKMSYVEIGSISQIAVEVMNNFTNVY